jgi:hypothetical protein
MKLMDKFRQEPREREMREREMREREAHERAVRERETHERAALSTADLAGAQRPAEPRADAAVHDAPVDVQWNDPRGETQPAGKLRDQDVADAVEVTRRDVRPDAGLDGTAVPVQRGPRAGGDAGAHVPSQARHARMPHAPGPDDPPAPLFSADVAQGFRSRWDATQIGFVDDPQQAVQQADELVAQVMKSLAQSFAEERARLEARMHGDSVSTEDLRVALQRYRSFFQRLLSL